MHTALWKLHVLRSVFYDAGGWRQVNERTEEPPPRSSQPPTLETMMSTSYHPLLFPQVKADAV